MMTAQRTEPAQAVPLNEVDKVFYLGEPFGSRTFNRFMFEFSGGRIDIGLLRAAYKLAQQRRPVLRARIVDDPADPVWNAVWVPRNEADAARAVRLHDLSGMSDEAAEACIGELKVDLLSGHSARTDPPVMLALCNCPGGRQKLLVYVSHILTDGYGGSLVTNELFTLYNQLAEGRAPQQCSCREPYLKAVPVLPASRVRRCLLVLGALAVTVAQAVKNGFREPSKIFPVGSGFGDAQALVQRAVPKERLSRYLAAAKRQGVTFNVFAVAAQVLAIDRWKKERGEPAGLISIDVPVNLRGSEQELRGLSNKVAAFTVATRPRDRLRPLRLLRHVHRVHEQARRSGTAEKLCALLWLLDSRRGVKFLQKRIKGLFNNPKMTGSVPVSNMGRPWENPSAGTRLTRLGDAEITACYAWGQPNPAVGAITTLQTFNDTLYVSFTYFRDKATDFQARRVVAMLEESLDELASQALGNCC